MSVPPGRGLWRRRARPARRLGCDVCRVNDTVGVVQREEGHERRYQPRRADLMARADTGPDVAVEVLVEEDVIAPQRIPAELPGLAVHGPVLLIVDGEDAPEPLRELPRDLNTAMARSRSGAGRS